MSKHRRQRAAPTTELRVGEDVYKTEEQIMRGWVRHFKGLATPKDDPSYDADYLRHVEADVAIIEGLAEEADEVDTITVKEV